MVPIVEESLEKLWYLRREVDRIFREYFESRKLNEAGETLVQIANDIYETKEELVVELEIAGVTKNDVEVYVQNNLIIIEGFKPGEENISGSLICAERVHGGFRRVIEFSAAIDIQRISAKLNNGVLTIRLPKITERRGRRRKIEIE